MNTRLYQVVYQAISRAGASTGSQGRLGKSKQLIRDGHDRPPKPFVKWAGGKRQLLARLRDLYPPEFRNYHEPFIGGGAVFFDISAIHGPLGRRAVLSDTNEELMDCYRAIRDGLDDLIPVLRKHRYEERYFYRQRERDPSRLSLVERAARMIYLNRAGFNGLYRVNSKGKFNVPFGQHKNPTICNVPNLVACASVLAGVKLRVESFEAAAKRVRPGDFVYFDPPYIPRSTTAYFTKYQKQDFGMANQQKLAEVFEQLASRGVYVMLSNSDVPWVHNHYRKYTIRPFMARRAVNADSARRGPVGEVVVTNY